MAGYVRCLNTAGKLSLLATVVTDNKTTRRVALVDLSTGKDITNSLRLEQKRPLPTGNEHWPSRSRAKAKCFNNTHSLE
jgi:hypothetical protein